MSTKKLACIVLIFIVLGFPFVAHAIDVTTQLGATAHDAGFQPVQQNPLLIVAQLIKTVLGLLGIIFVGLTLYAGFTIMTARGEEDKVAEGKKTLTRAVLGIIIIMSAFSLTLLAEKIATGDKKHQGDYIEVKNTDVNFQDTNQVLDVPKVGCPLGLKPQPDGTCGSYENAP